MQYGALRSYDHWQSMICSRAQEACLVVGGSGCGFGGWGGGLESEGVINNLQYAEFKRGKANLKSKDIKLSRWTSTPS